MAKGLMGNGGEAGLMRLVSHKMGVGDGVGLFAVGDKLIFGAQRSAYLPSSRITINGITESPYIQYYGGNANGVDSLSWPARFGQDLGIAGTGDDPNQNEYDTRFNPSRYYSEGSDTAYGNLGTDDIVIELVIRMSSDPTQQRVIYKHDGSKGYLVQFLNGRVYFYLEDAVAASANVFSNVLTDGELYHLIGFFDRSGSGAWYVNGASPLSASIAAVGSIDSAQLFSLGFSSGTLNTSLVAATIWKRAGWLDTHLQGAVALDRYNSVDFSVINEGTNLLADGDMELLGTNVWTPFGGSGLTKSTVDPKQGTQALRITRPTFAASQNNFIDSRQYKVTGWARGNGNIAPQVGTGSLFWWTGTTSTTWQAIDVTLTMDSNDQVILYSTSGLAGDWVEFDDMRVTEA